MSPMGALRFVAGLLVGFLGMAIVRRWKGKTAAPPSIEPTYPARNIEVNGFRYVLDTCDEKEQSR